MFFPCLYSYKQQHQTFIQHASQQITLLETQKQALVEQQQLQQHQHQQVGNKNMTNPIPSLLQPVVGDNQQDNANFTTGNLSNGNTMQGNSGGRIDRGPIPLMSQQVNMPNMNLPPPQQQQKQQQSYNNSNNNNNNANNINLDISSFQVSMII